MTGQRATLISGPVTDKHPLWEATLATAYSGPGMRPAVQKTHAVRTLVQDGRPSTIRVAGVEHPFHAPRLLHAAIEPRNGGWNELTLGRGTANSETVELRDTNSEYDDVLIAPRDPEDAWVGAAGLIETPPFTLVAGRLRVWIPLPTRASGGDPTDDPWLGYARIAGEHRLLTGVNGIGNSIDGIQVLAMTAGGTAYLPAELTSQGIMFFARVPDPLKAFSDAPDKIWARVRLFERPKAKGDSRRYALAFEGACEDPGNPAGWSHPAPALRSDHAEALEAGFASVFKDARDLGVRVDFDRRPVVPPFFWALGTRAGSSRPTFPRTTAGWECLFDEALFRINILSNIDGVMSSATLKCEEARLVIAGSTARLAFSSRATPSGKRKIPLSRDHAAPHWHLGKVQPKAFAAARLPIANVEERLRLLYADAKLVDPAVDSVVQAFMPIEQGWLQFPLRSAPVAPAAPIERSVLDGSVAFALDAEGHRGLELSAASASELTLFIAKVPAPACSELSLLLDDGRGRLRGLVHIADCSPAGGEILPTLRAGATREWPVLFGQGEVADCIGIVDPDPILGSFALDIPKGDPAAPETLVLSWQRDGAWISTRNLAQTRGSGLPVAARSLVPQLVTTPCRLSRSAGQSLPALASSAVGAVWTEWAAPVPGNPNYETSQILPTLPGVERHGVLAPYLYSLRHDLPPLDDLFAAMEIQDAPLLRLGQKDKPGSGRITALATAAAPGRLREAWRLLCDNHRLTRTRYRFAFERDDNSVDIKHLAMPFEWRGVPFRFDSDNGAGLPIGSYWLDGDQVAGTKALAGLSGALKVTKSGQAVEIALRGNAAARWSPSGSPLRYDLAGTGIDRRASLERPGEILATPDSGETIRLTTLEGPIDLEGDLHFWFRDIPFNGGSFEGRKGTDGFSGDIDTRAPEAFVLGLYEWRIWSSDVARASDIRLSHGFLARPLRLRRITGNSQTVTRLELVASLLAPEALDASRASEAGETAPAGNLVLVTYVAIGGGNFRRTVERVKVENDSISPFSAQEIADGRARATFDVRPQVDLTDTPGDASPRHGVLTCAVTPDGSITEARLTLTLFGHAIKFERLWGSTDNLDFAWFDFQPPADGPGKIVLESAQLAWATGLRPVKPARFTAAPRLSLPFKGHGNADLSLDIDFASSGIRWLGAWVGATAQVDHDKAAITVKGAGLHGSPVIGLAFDRADAAALFAVLPDLTVSGFAQVSATVGQDTDPSSVMLAHAFQFADAAWTNHMTLSFKALGQSTIQWPLNAVPTVDDRSEAEKAQVSTVSIEGGKALLHAVRCAIRGAPVSTLSLDASGRLAAPWHMSMRADHELRSPDQHIVRWTSLDEVMIADLNSLAALARSDAAAATPVYGFGARYEGLYRGHLSNGPPEMLRNGVFERGLVAAGFPDALVRDALAGAEPQGLVLSGAGVTMFELDSGESVVLALPWLLGTLGAELGPLASLRQAPTAGNKVWSAAWFDLRSRRLLSSAPGAPLALGDPSATRVASQIAKPDDDPAARPVLAAVEQPYFEDPDGAIDLAEAPLFLRSLIALASAWPALVALEDVQSRVMQPLIRRDGSCALFTPSLGTRNSQPRRLLRLVCIDEKTASLERPNADLDLASVASATPALLRILHGALERPPLLFSLMSLSAFEEEADMLALWTELELSGRTMMSGAAWQEPVPPALRDPSDQLFVSASLGWPEAPVLRDHPDTLTMGENMPFQNGEAAISGRSASFSSSAGGGVDGRPWLTLRLQPAFDAMALPGVMAASPRQLDVIPRRPRSPIVARQPNIVPSRFATASVGYRPGAAHITMTALKQPGSTIHDADGLAVAYRATHHPVLAGQDRMPRATVLPSDIDDLDWRRETFVLPRGSKCRIERVPAIAFRTYAMTSAPGGDVPPPDKLVVLKAIDPEVDLARAPQLVLSNDGSKWPDWHPYSWRQFRLRVGSRSWAFAVVETDDRIALTLGTAAAAEAAAYALTATGDTEIACELVLATSPAAADPLTPLAAPNLTLRLPLTIARATEPVLPVAGASLIFGDPAYDRMLSSMTASDSRRIQDSLAILATDRQTYDVASPVLISLGLKRADGKVEHSVDYRLAIKRFRESEEVTECEFLIEKTMEVASLSFDAMAAKGLKSVLPGDRLSITADFAVAGTTFTLGLQLLITREPAVPPAPGIYHLLTLHGAPATGLNAATALSASGPTPGIIEYPALAADLMDGYVRRRGLFVWHFAPYSQPYYARFGYLVKIDRSGAGQLPSVLEDFEAAIIAPPASQMRTIVTPWSDELAKARARRKALARKRKARTRRTVPEPVV